MPTRKPANPADSPTQAQKFKELAREVGADMGAEEFDGVLKGTRGTKPATKDEAFQAKREGKAD